jgi:hypothetical protein
VRVFDEDKLGDDDALGSLVVNLDALFRDGHYFVEKTYPLKAPKGGLGFSSSSKKSYGARKTNPTFLKKALNKKLLRQHCLRVQSFGSF